MNWILVLEISIFSLAFITGIRVAVEKDRMDKLTKKQNKFLSECVENVNQLTRTLDASKADKEMVIKKLKERVEFDKFMNNKEVKE